MQGIEDLYEFVQLMIENEKVSTSLPQNEKYSNLRHKLRMSEDELKYAFNKSIKKAER